MTHMISTIALPETVITGNTPAKHQRLVQYLFMLLMLCFFTINSFAQPKGSKPDPDQTYGKGSSMRTTQSTNPDSFIPETKTEYFDENDVLREEVIKTKDLDGNTVEIRKKYDETGVAKSRSETRWNKGKDVVFMEDIQYTESGEIRKGHKRVYDNGRWKYFNFDYETQTYKGPFTTPLGYVKPESPRERVACNTSRTELKLGYSYMVTANSGITGTLPTGAEIAMGYRLGDHTKLIVDVNGHQGKQNFQTLSRLNLQAGIEYDFNKCDNDNVVVYSRIAVGVSLENIRFKTTVSSATAPSGTAGLGANIKIFRRTSFYLGADWTPSYFNKTLQHNFQAGAGFAFRFGGK